MAGMDNGGSLRDFNHEILFRVQEYKSRDVVALEKVLGDKSELAFPNAVGHGLELAVVVQHPNNELELWPIKGLVNARMRESGLRLLHGD